VKLRPPRYEVRGSEGMFGVWDRRNREWAARPKRPMAEAKVCKESLDAAALR